MKNFQFVLAEGKTTIEALSNLTQALGQMFTPTNEARITSMFAIPEGRPANLASMGQPTMVLMVVACVEFVGEINTQALQGHVMPINLPDAAPQSE